jgi:cytochrome c-type biogenesis protein
MTPIALLGDVTSGLSQWWAPALAFAAGVVSFASPCVFPLVPGYLSFASGGQASDRKPLVPILLFILGFGAVFTALGASASALRFIKSDLGLRIAGGVVLLFGVAMVLYALRVGSPGLYAERRPFLSRVTRLQPGPAGAVPLGMAFAAGWTPCIGPVLGGILAIAGTQGSAARGAFLLFVYSLGLGVPFLLVGLGVRRLMGALDFVKRNYHWFAGVSGVVMVAIGVLLVSGLWQTLLTPILNRLSRVTPPI